MWIMVMFDLPTETKAQRKAYAQFRKKLLNDAFIMLQYSVYARHCGSEENCRVHMERVKQWVPDHGEVRVVQFTDKQFERIQIFYGKMTVPPEKPAAQLSFF